MKFERSALKYFYIYAAILGASFALSSETAHAQKYDSRVGNPFVFCSLPKPCKLCQPFRAIHEDICAGQSGTSKEEEPDPKPPTPVVTPEPPMNEAQNSGPTQQR